MNKQRRSVWADGAGWNDTLRWYARAVRALSARPVADRTSWRFLAAIHGHDVRLWRLFRYLTPNEPLASQADIDLFWDKCQHGSWYFLPWHRGYLSSFEQICRAAIVADGGPPDWALPYWNYSDENDPNAPSVHPAFLAQQMEDGSPNPLYTPFRFGDPDTGSTDVPASDASLKTLEDKFFTMPGAVAGGFGGGRWPLSHNGGLPGSLEVLPHGSVHVDVGGATALSDGSQVGGLMSAFETAGLDPIFWLHHANIDRLWEVWLRRRPANKNPSDQQWLGGALDRPFVMPLPDSSAWYYSCSEMVDTTVPALDYEYDDVSDPIAAGQEALEGVARVPSLASAVPGEMDTEMIGTNGAAIQLGRAAVSSAITVDPGILRLDSERVVQEGPNSEARPNLYLNLEDIKGLNNVATYSVVVDYGEEGGTLLSGEPRALTVGRFSTFNLAATNESQSGSMTISLNITSVLEQMAFDEVPSQGRLTVTIVPERTATSKPAPTIGRISIYREAP